MELYKGKYWEVVLDSCQEFIGNTVILSSKSSLSELTNDEWMELGMIEKELERICKKLFNATMFNFACLMNYAYLFNEKPFVHFHFAPRYKNEIDLFNKKYQDIHFGYNFWKWDLNKAEKQTDIFTSDEKQQIYLMMKKEIHLP